MTEFRRVTDQLSVSPQITLEDLPRAAAMGFKLVINNRPDGEDPAQRSQFAPLVPRKAPSCSGAFLRYDGGVAAWMDTQSDAIGR